MLAIDIYRNMVGEAYPYVYVDFKTTHGHLFEQILFEAERNFEITVVEAYPFEVQFHRIAEFDTLEKRIHTVETFLKRFPTDQYIAFPGNATGRYKECAVNSVFFKDPAHALITKLAFIG